MSQTRKESIDVLRGITIMLMIVVNSPGSWSHVYAPFLHAKWHGCTLTDLVFPSFLFVVGLSMSQSFRKRLHNNNSLIIRKILTRGVLIFLIGVLLNWFPFYNISIENLRLFGVLQRIALSFIGAGLIIVLVKNRLALVIASVLLLLLHWFILYVGAEDSYSLQENIGRYLDIAVVGESHMYGGFGIPFDPEGLLGSLTGMAQVLIGFIIGKNLYKEEGAKTKNILIAIILMFVLAKIWDLSLPINKPLWTGSYVLYSVSIVTALLLVLIEIVDKKGIKKWSLIFKVFGKNPLFSYILSGIFIKIFMIVIVWSDTNLYQWLFTDVFEIMLPSKLASLTMAIFYTFFIWVFAYALYKKDITIKV